MTTLSISSTKTMTYNAEESARAFAIVERIAGLAGSILVLVRKAVASSTVPAARLAGV